MKRAVLVTAALLASFTLIGCVQTTDDVERDAAFAKLCHDRGGRVYYNTGISCDFTDGPTKEVQ